MRLIIFCWNNTEDFAIKFIDNDSKRKKRRESVLIKAAKTSSLIFKPLDDEAWKKFNSYIIDKSTNGKV